MDSRPRIRTRFPGVYYRLRADGTRQHIYEFTDSEGKQRFKNFPGGERECAKERAKMISRLSRGERVVPNRILFADFARSWLEEQVNLAPQSVETYRWAIEKHLVPRFGARMMLSSVDVDRVAQLIASMQKDGHKANSIRQALRTYGHLIDRKKKRDEARERMEASFGQLIGQEQVSLVEPN